MNGIPPLTEEQKMSMLNAFKTDNYDPKTMIMAPEKQTSSFSRSNVSPVQGDNPNNILNMIAEKVPPLSRRENIPVSPIEQTPDIKEKISLATQKLAPEQKIEMQKEISDQKARGANAGEIFGTILSYLGQGLSGLGAASRAYVGDQGGTAQHLDYFGKVGQERQKRLETKDHRDPNSDLSKMARKVAQDSGMTVSDKATFESLKKIIPGFQSLVQQKMSYDNKTTQDMTPYQKESLELRKQSAQQASETKRRQLQKEIQPLEELNDTFKDVERILGFTLDDYSEGKVGDANMPGHFGIGPDITSLDKNATELESQMQKIQNVILKARSGGAVTENEAERMKKELSGSWAKGEAARLTALSNVYRDIKNLMAQTKAGYGDDVVRSYEESYRDRTKKQTSGNTKEANNFVIREQNGVKYKFDPNTKENLGRYDGQ